MTLDGCIICGRVIATIGIFVPESARMRNAVIRLQTHADPSRQSGVAYGLCSEHSADLDSTKAVEAAILVAAEKVQTQ